jgi:hypothetical protein
LYVKEISILSSGKRLLNDFKTSMECQSITHSHSCHKTVPPARLFECCRCVNSTDKIYKEYLNPAFMSPKVKMNSNVSSVRLEIFDENPEPIISFIV